MNADQEKRLAANQREKRESIAVQPGTFLKSMFFSSVLPMNDVYKSKITSAELCSQGKAQQQVSDHGDVGDYPMPAILC